MKNIPLLLSVLLFLPAVALTSIQAEAAGHPFEFHADGKMASGSQKPVDGAYGYMNVTTNKKGQGLVSVMFSNGNRSNQARFNARVRFLDTDGSLVREELFDRWMSAASGLEAIESKQSKRLDLAEIESVEVEFFLSDVETRLDDDTIRISRAVE